ncbi:hypothetical protein PTKIN_Ptkin14bG0121800 [Pterospermum kingtungense]
MSNMKASRKRPWGCRNIDRLPDAILEHVLSFLPTKEAVATSILSKRWRSIWTRVPVLDIQDSPSCKTNEELRKAFNQFVNRVLILNRVVALDKFRLNCDIIHGPPCLNTWTDSAIFHRDFVREVDISISPTQVSPIVELPSSLFRIKDLKVLKLSHGVLIDVPNSISVRFPSLKILHLDSVQYFNDESVSKLLGSCTVLEELSVTRYSQDKVRKFIINIPTLKNLNICHEFAPEFGSGDYELKINAPVLEYLDIVYAVFGLLHLESVFVRLIKAKIYLIGSTNISGFTNALQKIKSLSYDTSLNTLAPVKDDSFPQTQLQLKIFPGCWDVIRHFLVNCPHLEVLIFHKVS